jgi:glutamine amidotransferase
MITILDIGMGNIGSIRNMLRYIGTSVSVESEPSKISDASKIILPGVGSFDAAMEKINRQKGLINILEKKASDNTPILGVCLGMQLLTNKSEEGILPGLGLISAETIRFPSSPKFKVPHMGWNDCTINNPSPITSNIDLNENRYYFVHSYYVKVENSSHSLMTSQYGVDFDSVIGRDNIFGVQFHPEKSLKFGMQIFKNFVDL